MAGSRGHRGIGNGMQRLKPGAYPSLERKGTASGMEPSGTWLEPWPGLCGCRSVHTELGSLVNKRRNHWTHGHWKRCHLSCESPSCPSCGSCTSDDGSSHEVPSTRGHRSARSFLLRPPQGQHLRKREFLLCNLHLKP